MTRTIPAGRRRRWLIIAGCIGAAIAIVLAAGYVLVMPWLVHRRIAATLEAAGLEDVRLDVHRATPWGAEVSELIIGKGDDARVAGVVLRYSPRSLWQGGVDSITLRDAEVVVRVEEGLVQAGVLAALRPGTEPDSPHPAEWPMQRIRLERSTLVVRLPEGDVRLPVTGEMRRRDEADYELRARIDIGQGPLGVRGALRPIAGRFEINAWGKGIDAAVLWPVVQALQPGAEVMLSGALGVEAQVVWHEARDDQALQATLHVELTPMDIAVQQIEAADDAGVRTAEGEARPLISGIGGVLRLEGIVWPAAERHLELVIADGRFQVRPGGISVSGLSGQVALDGTGPLRTIGPQRLDVERLAFAETAWTNGEVEFELYEPRSLRLGPTRWQWLGGSVWSDETEIDPAEPSFDLVLHAGGVDMQQVLELLLEERASGEGQVDGHLLVQVRGPSVRIGSGSFAAAEGGRLQVLDTSMIEGAMAEMDARADREGAGEMILEAIRDFRYSLLRAELRPTDEGLIAQVRIEGYGRRGARQAIRYDLNVTGLDDLLAEVFGLRELIYQR